MTSTSDLLAHFLNNGQSGATGAQLNERLVEIAQRDPRLAPLVQRIQERLTAAPPQAESEPEESVEPDEQEIDALAQLQQLEERNKKLKRMARRMFEELKALRERTDMLAEVLGACHLCWGEDTECAYCGGAGHIGAYLINQRKFEQTIGPAVRQLEERPRPVQQVSKSS